MRTHHDAQDVVSETVYQALMGFSKLRDEQAFVSYIFTIARRIVKRRNWRNRFFGEYDEASALAIPHSDMSPEVQMDVVLLRAALLKLSEKTREAIVMFELNGFSLEEIRQLQGGSLSGVKTRLLRGRKQLARILETDSTSERDESISEPIHHESLLHQHTIL